MKTKIWTMCLFCLLAYLQLRSQEATVSSGGDILTETGSISYSVGLPFFTAMQSEVGSISQGVQHTYKFVTVSNQYDPLIHLDLLIYPNPTLDVVFLQVKSDQLPAGLKYHLYDSYGKLISYNNVTDQHTPLDMKTLPASVYLMTVFDTNQIYQSFQIIKY